MKKSIQQPNGLTPYSGVQILTENIKERIHQIALEVEESIRREKEQHPSVEEDDEILTGIW